jgi:hypothetical protein
VGNELRVSVAPLLEDSLSACEGLVGPDPRVLLAATGERFELDATTPTSQSDHDVTIISVGSLLTRWMWFQLHGPPAEPTEPLPSTAPSSPALPMVDGETWCELLDTLRPDCTRAAKYAALQPMPRAIEVMREHFDLPAIVTAESLAECGTGSCAAAQACVLAHLFVSQPHRLSAPRSEAALQQTREAVRLVVEAEAASGLTRRVVSEVIQLLREQRRDLEVGRSLWSSVCGRVHRAHQALLPVLCSHVAERRGITDEEEGARAAESARSVSSTLSLQDSLTVDREEARNAADEARRVVREQVAAILACAA